MTTRSLLLVTSLASTLLPPSAAEPTVRWSDALRQPATWYAGTEAARVAETVILHQRTSGGWPKNVDMARTLTDTDRTELEAQRSRPDSTIDNGATTTQLRFLARVHQAQPAEAWRVALLRGFDYLLDAQYPNGGWPQYWPQPRGYAAHITFNDNAMISVMALLREATQVRGEVSFLDEGRRARAEAAVARGIECILRCQIVVEGRRTVWCAQHDATSLAPAGARTYEHPSLSGAESVGIVRFLMGIESPDARVIEAIEAAVAWFGQATLRGIRVVERSDPTLPRGHDRVVVEDASAPPVWARFYEIGSNRPIFSGRDGLIRYRLADIEHERRVGYAWYTEAPARLLGQELTVWRTRIGARQ